MLKRDFIKNRMSIVCQQPCPGHLRCLCTYCRTGLLQASYFPHHCLCFVLKSILPSTGDVGLRHGHFGEGKDGWQSLPLLERNKSIVTLVCFLWLCQPEPIFFSPSSFWGVTLPRWITQSCPMWQCVLGAFLSVGAQLPGNYRVGSVIFFFPRVNLHLPGIGGYRSTGDPDFNAIFCGLVEHIPSKSTAAFECNKLFINTHINPWTEQQGKTSNPFFPQDMKCSKLIIPEASRAGEPVIKVDVSTDLRIAVVGHRRTKYCPSGLVIPQITCCFMPWVVDAS